MIMSLFKFKLFKFVSLPTGKFPVSNGFSESICPFFIRATRDHAPDDDCDFCLVESI